MFLIDKENNKIKHPLVTSLLFPKKHKKSTIAGPGLPSASPVLARYITTLCRHFYFGFLGWPTC
jgi:hypothetical protein